MAFVVPALAAIGTALVPTASGGAAAAIGGFASLSAVSSIAGTGLGIAQAAGAFAPKIPEAPGFPGPDAAAQAAQERKRRLAAARRNPNIVGGRRLGPETETQSTALFGPGASA